MATDTVEALFNEIRAALHVDLRTEDLSIALHPHGDGENRDPRARAMEWLGDSRLACAVRTLLLETDGQSPRELGAYQFAYKAYTRNMHLGVCARELGIQRWVDRYYALLGEVFVPYEMIYADILEALIQAVFNAGGEEATRRFIQDRVIARIPLATFLPPREKTADDKNEEALFDRLQRRHRGKRLRIIETPCVFEDQTQGVHAYVMVEGYGKLAWASCRTREEARFEALQASFLKF